MSDWQHTARDRQAKQRIAYASVVCVFGEEQSPVDTTFTLE